MDISHRLTRVGKYYIIGSRKADLWQGKYGDAEVIIKVLRGVAHQGSNHNQRLIEWITTWQGLDHPNVSQIHGLTIDGSFSALVLPYFLNGNIIDYRKSNPSLSPKAVFSLIKESIAGLVYLHKYGIVHSNIHGCNIAIDKDGHAVLCDIGMETLVCKFEPQLCNMSAKCRWMAPELLIIDDEATTVVPTLASDVYAAARTIVEVYTLRPPFDGDVVNDFQFIWKLRNGLLRCCERPVDMAPEIWYAVGHCWAPQPEKRPTAYELLHFLEEVELK